MDARYLRVSNREKFQHYKDRCPPWIKLNRTVITGEDKQLDDFLLLEEWEQWQLVRVWLLASQCEGFLLAFDERWVRRAIRSTRKVALEKFIRMGFLEVLSAEEADAERASALASAGASTTLAPDASDAASALANAHARRAGTEKTEVPEKDPKAVTSQETSFARAPAGQPRVSDFKVPTPTLREMPAA
jgi:hypothetical protein